MQLLKIKTTAHGCVGMVHSEWDSEDQSESQSKDYLMDNNSIMLRGLQAPCIQNQDIEQKVGCHLDLFYTYVTKADNELAWSKNSNNEAIWSTNTLITLKARRTLQKVFVNFC